MYTSPCHSSNKPLFDWKISELQTYLQKHHFLLKILLKFNEPFYSKSFFHVFAKKVFLEATVDVSGQNAACHCMVTMTQSSRCHAKQDILNLKIRILMCFISDYNSYTTENIEQLNNHCSYKHVAAKTKPKNFRLEWGYTAVEPITSAVLVQPSTNNKLLPCYQAN